MMPRSIRARIIVLLLALAVPLAAILAFTLVAEYRTNADRAEGAAVELARATANGVNQVVGDTHATLSRLALDSSILALDAPRCAPWLREVTDMLPQFANIAVVNAAGRVVCSGAPAGGNQPDVTDRSWFREVMRTGRPATGHYQVGNITGLAVIVLAHPLTGADGEIRGAVVAGVDLNRFQRLFDDLPQPPGSVVTLADDEWTVIARSREADRWIGQTLPGDTVPERSVGAGVGVLQAVGLDGVARVFGFSAVGSTGWRVYAGVPSTWIYAPVRQAAVRRGVALGLVLLVVTFLAGAFFRRISRSIRGLVEGTRAAATGEGRRVPEAGPTEVVEVAKQFNATLAARDRAEEELRRARERYASILRNAVSGIFVATAEGRFVELNPALVRMLGYPSETALRSVNARVLFANPDRLDALLTKTFAGERLQGEEVEWERFDGERVVARLSCGVATTTEGDPVLEVIAEDVTEQRALADSLMQTRKMEAIGRLAGGVAHDFNNLLTIVRGQAQFLLLEMGDNEDLREHAHEIVDATKRGERLTRQLLAFGRRQQVRPASIDINALVRDLQPMLRRVTGENIRIEIRLDAALPPAFGDPGQVEQVIMNLAFNARDAMQEAGTLRFSTRAVTYTEEDCRGRAGARPGEFIALSVDDTGTGISAEVIGRVFEPFFTTKPQGQGTGLGLATVYGIASQSGGWTEVQSVTGEGATFTVYLPRAETEAPEPAPSDEILEDSGGETVLVVEDEDAVRLIVVSALRTRGYTVLEAAHGDAAIAVAGQHRGTIEVLVTDEMMPGLRGTQLAEKLVPTRPEMRVLFMSGYSDRIPAGSTFCGTPSSFIGKPFSHEQVVQAVGRLLRRDRQTAPAG